MDNHGRDIARQDLNDLLPTIREQAAKELSDRVSSGELNPEVKVELDVLPDGTTRSVWNSRHGALGFHQVNEDQNQRLQAYVRENLSSGAHVFDLFGGSGNFTLTDAHRYAAVECVDVGSPGVPVPGQLEHYRFFKAEVAGWLERRANSFKPEHIHGPLEIVLDPPREGLAGAALRVTESLEKLSANKVIAIGCDADSWARDLSEFLRTGWNLRKIALFDLFPQTPHIESVAILDRNG